MTRTIAPFAEWEQLARVAVVGDPLWTVQAFRLSTYAVQANRVDRQNSPTFDSATSTSQLTRALGSVAANIAEGYSRSSLAERQRFYGYALGSVREAIVWYDTLEPELGKLVVDRQAILVQVRRLLLATIRRARPAAGLSILRNPGVPGDADRNQ